MKIGESTVYKCLIIGSGAAGLNCALQLVRRGIKPQKIAIITEELGGGTSFNTGSDKQTYYKLSLAGQIPDSPYNMAKAYFKGGSMHGDVALIESAVSVPAFMNLVNLGVPFPHDRFGSYVGFKTDNDPLQRGTSVGPLTSQEMGKYLLKAVRGYNIPIENHKLVVKIIKTKTGEACGVLALDNAKLSQKGDFDAKDLPKALVAYNAEFVILATGGPSGMYGNCVYPESQWGAMSLGIEAGAKLQNLTESQFGLGSLDYRWNVSGSYQQVIPRYISISVDEDIDDPNVKPHEFLREYFPTMKLLTVATFLKGYQWPFNSERIENYGSSLVDMAVHVETVERNRKVYLDFQHNPEGFEFAQLDDEVKNYLTNCGATQPVPFERLETMNPKAIKLYLNHGIDITRSPLRIGLCAQHLNGGFTGDIWYQSSVPRLFAIGENNGAHGVHRPGGAALNAGQVGGWRVAEKIVNFPWSQPLQTEKFQAIAEKEEKEFCTQYTKMWNNSDAPECVYPASLLHNIQERMMKCGAYIRKMSLIEESIVKCYWEITNFYSKVKINSYETLCEAWKTYDALLTQTIFLESIREYITKGGGSRGSYLVVASPEDKKVVYPHFELKAFPIRPQKEELKSKILEIWMEELTIHKNWVNVRPIPMEDSWFETTWHEFESGEIFRNT